MRDPYICAAHPVPGGGDGAWPQLAGWFEERATQVLEQPEGVAGHGQAAPAAGGPVQDSPDQGQAGGLAGEPADDLGAAAGLAGGTFDEDAQENRSDEDDSTRLSCPAVRPGPSRRRAADRGRPFDG